MTKGKSEVPIILIVALLIIVGVELLSIVLSGFNIIRFLLLSTLVYLTSTGSIIAKRYLIMLLILGIGLAAYTVYQSGFNKQLIFTAIMFIIPYILSIALLQFPASVKAYFSKKT